MVHSFILPQETIASIQERIEVLEICLNDAKPQDEAMELGDITPQESETVLTFLASKKKWDWVYQNLA
jgi:hypothetical protein